ncbi:MAG TPA: biopolymer transporter ExbD [Candidatus Pseudomonas excrementavium]|uniref:ExbD/TolR family protein n=1 Tax=Halopseudomonas bauzanensis TaxID=653930 RepID=UPI001C39EE32|nr:biopolymer transporter ExbD [Halopseudomonas bauzanensis]HIZ49705.1 biopolymer transporter ExbD [Candidatus Pseudomonas excrementavium]
MNFRRTRREEVGVNLTPLIDVVFLLLIFFMVSTTFTRETQLQLDLPESASGEPVENQNLEQIEVLVSAAGEVTINGKSLINPNLDSLQTALQREAGGNNSLPVVITADAKASHQSVITVMDAAGQQGFSRLRLTTNELETPAQ